MSRVGGWKGGFSKMELSRDGDGIRWPAGRRPAYAAAATAICLGWEGGRVDFQKRGQDEMVICLGWEGGGVDFQKSGKRRW